MSAHACNVRSRGQICRPGDSLWMPGLSCSNGSFYRKVTWDRCQADTQSGRELYSPDPNPSYKILQPCYFGENSPDSQTHAAKRILSDSRRFLVLPEDGDSHHQRSLIKSETKHSFVPRQNVRCIYCEKIVLFLFALKILLVQGHSNDNF